MTMIPVGSGEASEINSLEQQARAEYGSPKKAKAPKKPPTPKGHRHHQVTPRGAAVHVHNQTPGLSAKPTARPRG